MKSWGVPSKVCGPLLTVEQSSDNLCTQATDFHSGAFLCCRLQRGSCQMISTSQNAWNHCSNPQELSAFAASLFLSFSQKLRTLKKRRAIYGFLPSNSRWTVSAGFRQLCGDSIYNCEHGLMKAGAAASGNAQKGDGVRRVILCHSPQLENDYETLLGCAKICINLLQLVLDHRFIL